MTHCVFWRVVYLHVALSMVTFGFRFPFSIVLKWDLFLDFPNSFCQFLNIVALLKYSYSFIFYIPYPLDIFINNMKDRISTFSKSNLFSTRDCDVYLVENCIREKGNKTETRNQKIASSNFH